MAVAAGFTGTMGSWKVATSIKGDEEELGSDVDHNEMVNAYLSRWLPNIKDGHMIAEEEGTASQGKNIKEEEAIIEQHRPTWLEGNPKSSSQNVTQNQPQQEKDGDDFKDTKINREAKRKTYFEAIKCSPMKLRQSIVTQNRPKHENTRKFRSSETLSTTDGSSTFNETSNEYPTENSNQRSDNPPADEKLSNTRSTMRPCVVEMTGGPPGKLGSLCFKSKDAERRRSDVVYTSLAGGKMRKLHWNKSIKSGRNKSDLLVRCESVMIYPKALVTPRTEKPPTKSLFYPKEAWKDAPGRDATRLPELDETPPIKYDRKSPPYPLARSPHAKPTNNYQSSQNSASTKIIVPFGEDESKQNAERNLEHVQNADEMKGTEKIASSHEQRYYKTSRNRENQITRHSRFPEAVRRKVPGIVIGITQLEIPRSTALVTQQMMTSSPRSPTKSLQFLRGNDLLPGNENLPPRQKSTSPRHPFSPKKRVDFSRKNTTHTMTSDDEQENAKYFVNSRRKSSLKIGGTGLLKEHRGLQENFDEIKQVDVDEKKRVRFNVLVPHSRYFT